MPDERHRLTLEVDPTLGTECPFCLIGSGQAQATVVGESAECVAFFPDAPATPGHTLVIPRRHVQHFLLTDAELGRALMTMVVRVGRALQDVLAPEGMNLISSAGSAATQTVPHLHLHVVPRWSFDAIGDIWPPERPMDDALEEDLADRVRAADHSS